MKLVPVGDRILVKPVEAEEVTPSGIILPDSAQEKPARALVIAVGPGRIDEQTHELIALEEFEPGQIIHHNKYAGAPVEHEGEGYLVLRHADVLLIEEDA